MHFRNPLSVLVVQTKYKRKQNIKGIDPFKGAMFSFAVGSRGDVFVFLVPENQNFAGPAWDCQSTPKWSISRTSSFFPNLIKKKCFFSTTTKILYNKTYLWDTTKSETWPYSFFLRNLTLLLILLQVNFFKLERKKKINFGFEKMKEPLDTHETPAGTYASFITVSAGAAVLSPGSHWFSRLLDTSHGKGCTEPNRYH